METLAEQSNIRRPLSREQVRKVPCPACGVLAGEPCRGVHGRPRKSNHAARVERRSSKPLGKPWRRYSEPKLAAQLREYADDVLAARAADSRRRLRGLDGKPGRQARNGRRALRREMKLIAAEVDRRRRRRGMTVSAAARLIEGLRGRVESR